MLDIVYKAETKNREDETFTYIGMTAEPFRKRFAKHAQSFRNPRYSNETKLSRKVWNIKETEGQWNGAFFEIEKLSKSYSPGDFMCKLCIDEKIAIIGNQSDNLLNNRIEIFAKCRHRARHKLRRILE